MREPKGRTQVRPSHGVPPLYKKEAEIQSV